MGILRCGIEHSVMEWQAVKMSDSNNKRIGTLSARKGNAFIAAQHSMADSSAESGGLQLPPSMLNLTAAWRVS